MYRVSDFCIGDFPVIENFGQNPAVYNARYNIQGYPGIRIAMPSLTPILSVAPGFVLETGMEEGGKGKFITIVHEGFLSTYGHLNDQLVQKDEKVIAGQLIGHSNQSGLAEEPCLYFGIAPCDPAGTKTEQNGYDGYINPLDTNLVKWDIKNLTEPLTKADSKEQIPVPTDEYTAIVAQATNYKVIINFLKGQTNFDDFLVEKGIPPVNLDVNPTDSAGGNAVIEYLSTIADEFEEMNDQIAELSKTDNTTIEEPAVPLVKKPHVLVRLTHAVKRFVLKSDTNG